MNCVAKRLPATGAPGFFPQATFELHQQAQPTTSQAYLYSIHPLAAAAVNDQTDSDEEPKRQEPLVQRKFEEPPDGPSSRRGENNAELKLRVTSHEQCDEPKPADLLISSFKCPASKAESSQPTSLNSCDKSPVRCNDNQQGRCESLIDSAGSPELASSTSTNEAPSQSHRRASSRPSSRSGASARSAGLGRSRSVLVSTRFVSPPKIDDDQLISVIKWQTIPLNDDDQHKRTNGELAPQQQPQVSCHSGRLNSLITSCKVLSSQQSSHGAGGKQTGSNEKEAKDEETRKVGKKEEQSAERLGGHRHRTLSEGSAGGGRKTPFGRERVGSATSFKSAGSFHRSKPQIGKVRAPFMFAGILGSMLGSLFFSIGMLCIKLLPDGHGLAEKTKLVFCRGCIMTLLCGATILYQKSTFKIRRDEIWVNALRSVLGFLGVYGAYVALKYISMGDSTALVFSSPIWTSLLSHFILNEPLHWIQLLALPASLLGIIFIAHPALLIDMEQHAGASERQPLLDVVDVLEASDLLPLSNSTANMVAQLNQTLNRDLDISMSSNEQFDFEHRWKGIVISLATSFIVSFVYIVLKFRKTTPIQTTTFWLGVATAVFSLFVMCFTGFGAPPSGLRNWSLLICNGVCSWLGQVLLQWALAYEDASVLSVIRTLDVAMNFGLSALFLDEQIMWTSVLGASIIALVVVSIMLNSWISKRLCPAKLEVEPNEQLESTYDDDDELSTSESRFSPASRNEEKAPVEGEITLKLEAPSLRKLRQGELAA